MSKPYPKQSNNNDASSSKIQTPWKSTQSSALPRLKSHSSYIQQQNSPIKASSSAYRSFQDILFEPDSPLSSLKHSPNTQVYNTLHACDSDTTMTDASPTKSISPSKIDPALFTGYSSISPRTMPWSSKAKHTYLSSPTKSPARSRYFHPPKTWRHQPDEFFPRPIKKSIEYISDPAILQAMATQTEKPQPLTPRTMRSEFEGLEEWPYLEAFRRDPGYMHQYRQFFRPGRRCHTAVLYCLPTRRENAWLYTRKAGDSAWRRDRLATFLDERHVDYLDMEDREAEYCDWDTVLGDDDDLCTINLWVKRRREHLGERGPFGAED